MRTEAQIIQDIGRAQTLSEQSALVSELDALKAARRTALADSRALDLASSVVEATLSPVLVHERHTASTDWLSEVQMSTEADVKTATNAMAAEASLWFARTSADVRADAEEFTEQARGMARRLAGKYGEQAVAAAQSFIDYAAFLRQREAGSGLPQLGQTYDANNNLAPTELPFDTQDNFAPDVDPVNAGVDDQVSSERAPLLNEILQNGNGTGTPEKPGGHSTAPAVAQASLANNQLFTLDDFKKSASLSTPETFSTDLWSD